MDPTPEHFWTEPLGDRYAFDNVPEDVVETRYFLKSEDYTEVWVEWELQAPGLVLVTTRFKIDDGVNPPVYSSYFSTALGTWQDSGKKVIDISGLLNVVCTIQLLGGGSGKVRGIVALEA